MTRWPLELRRASEGDLRVIVGMIEDAAAWLGAMGTDQWAEPWPDENGRDRRILADLLLGRTWIGWDDATPAATITLDPDQNPAWPERWRDYPAIQVHRLVVARTHARVSLGAELLDWAGRIGAGDHGAEWVRVNAWTTNRRLHDYYRGQGFALCGYSTDNGLHYTSKPASREYPSAAMFQKPVAEIRPIGRGLFVEVPDDS